MSVRRELRNWESRSQPLAVTGAATRIWREGDGEPVVCLHGVPTSAYLYRKLLPELAARGLQGVAFDLPGLGLAERPQNFDYRWSGLAGWVMAALEAAGIERFHLVVHDIGGPIGFDVIRREPQRIRSLTVLNTMLHVSRFRRPWPMEPFAHAGIGWLWLQGMRTPLFLPLMRMLGVHRGPSLDELRTYQALLFREDGGRAFLQIMRGSERTAEFERGILAALADRAFPARVVWGGQDPALKKEKYVPAICEALGLEAGHDVWGKHFLQENSPAQIAEHVAAVAAEAEE